MSVWWNFANSVLMIMLPFWHVSLAYSIYRHPQFCSHSQLLSFFSSPRCEELKFKSWSLIFLRDIFAIPSKRTTIFLKPFTGFHSLFLVSIGTKETWWKQGNIAKAPTFRNFQSNIFLEIQLRVMGRKWSFKKVFLQFNRATSSGNWVTKDPRYLRLGLHTLPRISKYI